MSKLLSILLILTAINDFHANGMQIDKRDFSYIQKARPTRMTTYYPNSRDKRSSTVVHNNYQIQSAHDEIANYYLTSPRDYPASYGSEDRDNYVPLNYIKPYRLVKIDHNLYKRG